MTDPSAGEGIRADRLTKRFASLPALSGIDLHVAAGESVAIFGPNGAGKTTLVRVLTLGLRPSEGSFRIAGLDPRRQDREIRRSIGLISHQSFLYLDLSARQNLEFFAALYGVPDPQVRAERLLGEVGLTARAEDPVRTFSRGMTQRLSLARALVHDPGTLFLDEPFAGLDPHAARMLRQTLSRLREERRTVLLVTHDLSQGLELSDRWFILSRGRVVAEGRSRETDRSEFEESYFREIEDAGRPRA